MVSKLQWMAALVLDARHTSDRARSTARARVARRDLECDVLEGRQLLSRMPGLAGMMGSGRGMRQAQWGGALQSQAQVGSFRAMGGAQRLGGGGGALAFGQNQGGVGGRAQSQAIFAAGQPQQGQGLGQAGLGRAQRLGRGPAALATTAQTTTSDAATITPATLPVVPSFTAKSLPSANQADPGIDAALKADLDKLQTDIHAILAKSSVTVAQRTAVADNFKAIQDASTSAPSDEARTALEEDLKALNGSLPTTEQAEELKSDFTELLKSQGITDQTLIDKTISDLSAVITASNITNDDLATLAADREAIASHFDATTDASQPADSLGGFPLGLFLGDAGMPGGPQGGMPGGPQGGMPGDWATPDTQTSDTATPDQVAPGGPGGPMSFHQGGFRARGGFGGGSGGFGGGRAPMF